MQPWKRSFNAIWIAEFIAIAGFATSQPVIPFFFEELGVSAKASLNMWTGLTNTCASLSMMIFAPIWGAIADSYGRKLMLLRAMIGGAVLVGLMAAANAPWQVLLLRTLQGMLTGTVAAATVLTAASVPLTEVGYRLGLIQMAVYLGNSIGPYIGGKLSEIVGIRVNFLATSVLLASAAFIVTRFVREDFTPKPRTASIFRNAIPDFSPLKKVPALASLMGALFAVQFANAVVGPMMPLFIKELMENLGRNSNTIKSTAGLIIMAGSLTGALAAGIIGRLSGRIGYGKTLIFCLAGAFCFYVPQGFVTAPWQLFALRLGSGFFLGGTLPSINALIASLCQKDKQGSTYGLSSSIASAGMALGPAVGSTVATVAGYPAVFFVTSGIMGLTGIAVARSVRRKQRIADGIAEIAKPEVAINEEI